VTSDRPGPPRVHLVGASGSGTTTLGRALAPRLAVPVFDSDDAFWEPTDPPFRTPRPPPDRLAWLQERLRDDDGWVVSGSLCGWGDDLRGRFTFLTLPAAIRMARLAAREVERYGDRIRPGGDIAEGSTAFLAWAAAYDTAGMEQRSRVLHDAWLATLTCPVLHLDGDLTVEGRADRVAAAVDRAPR
jgi:adenylate kinase family enzyme